VSELGLSRRQFGVTAVYHFLFVPITNFALDVVTGIVQEFQFGMNWSAYSRQAGNTPAQPAGFRHCVASCLLTARSLVAGVARARR
jgi:cytochrome bd ubiquinol oxidase subunit I